MEQSKSISKATLIRLPGYLRFLKTSNLGGEDYISSTTIAEGLNLNPIQVRKDLSQVSVADGRPKLGFKVKRAYFRHGEFSRLQQHEGGSARGGGAFGKNSFVVQRLSKYALEIVAAFDVNPSLSEKQSTASRFSP